MTPLPPLSGGILFLLDSCLRRNDKAWIFRNSMKRETGLKISKDFQEGQRPGKRKANMHQSSFEKMLDFRNRYLTEFQGHPLKILDLGSQDLNGSYREIFNDPAWSYTGADLAPGKNVDIVLDDPYRWKAIKGESIDVLISGQAFEHIEFFWLTMLEAARVLKTGGLVCIIAPSGGYEHRHPVDCWRFYPDGMRALARFARLEALEAKTDWNPDPYKDYSHLWKDTVLIAKRPDDSFLGKIKFGLLSWLMRRICK
jgi:SAM-dependent methyltransferase